MEIFSTLLAPWVVNLPVSSLHKGQYNFDVFFDLLLKNDWVNNRDAGDLRRHPDHYDVTVMYCLQAVDLFMVFYVATYIFLTSLRPCLAHLAPFVVCRRKFAYIRDLDLSAIRREPINKMSKRFTFDRWFIHGHRLGDITFNYPYGDVWKTGIVIISNLNVNRISLLGNSSLSWAKNIWGISKWR